MKWSTADIIDLEYFLAVDREKNERDLRQRDETLYVRDVKPCLDAASLGHDDNRAKLRCWLEARRAAEQQSAPTPGEFYRMSFRWLLWIAAVVGCLLGSGLAVSLFRWYGDRPINVTWFFAHTVLVQFALLCAVLFLLVCHRGARVRHSLMQSLVSAALAKLAGLGEKALGHLTGERRERVRAGLGIIRAKKTIYGSLAYWPVLVITQMFAIGFNVGLLATILSWVQFSELSFGWSSTREEPHQNALVRAVSLPWTWAPHARPTPDQVRASRVHPAQMSIELDPIVRRSWWPFVCYAIATYGLIPRVLLLRWAVWKLRRTLKRIPFDHADCQALLSRLGGLLVESGEAPPLLPAPEIISTPNEASCRRCIALVSADIEMPEQALVETIENSLRQQVSSVIRAEIDCLPACEDALKTLERSPVGMGDGVCVAIIIEAWQAPREAYFSFIHELRKRIGKTGSMIVMLIAGTAGKNVAEEDWRAWLQKITSLGDPYLRLEKQL